MSFKDLFMKGIFYELCGICDIFMAQTTIVTNYIYINVYKCSRLRLTLDILYHIARHLWYLFKDTYMYTNSSWWLKVVIVYTR